MADLFRQADKYYMLEDEVRAASQQVLVTNRPTKNNEARSSKPLNQSRQASKWDSPPSVSPMKDSFLSFVIYHTSGHQNLSRQIWLSEIGIEGAPIIRITVISPSNARVSITWWRN